MSTQPDPGGAGPSEAAPARRKESLSFRKAQERAEAMTAYAAGEGRWVHSIEDAPTYHPTPAEFAEPLRFIHSIQAVASKFGICKIVPPVLPTTLATSVLNPAGKRKMSFGTRRQRLRAEPWEDFNPGRFMESAQQSTLADFEERAHAFHRAKFGTAGLLPPRIVEAEYWRHKEGPEAGQAKDEVVEYGNDVVGTAFAEPESGDPLASSKWNLQVLPTLEDSTLRLLDVDVPGVSSPMLYVGMLFASFAWHVEDQYLYSINYQHHGAAKTWYGVPASDADAFERVVQTHVYKHAAEAARAQGKSEAHILAACQKALIGKTTMVNPKLLMDNGVRVCRAVQQPGEFVITFPRGYHAGFSNGFCLGEAANFALADWLPFGAAACRRYARLGHAPLLAQAAVLCSEAEELAEHVGPIPGTKARVIPEFVNLVRSTQLHVQQLQAAGATVKMARRVDVACSHCRETCYLAHAMPKAARHAYCLCCATAPERLRSSGGGGAVLVHPDLARYATLALELEGRARGECTLPMVGLEDPVVPDDAPGLAVPTAATGSAPLEDSDASVVDGEGRSVRSPEPPPRRADPRRSGGARPRTGRLNAPAARGADAAAAEGALPVAPAAVRRQRSPRPQGRKRQSAAPRSSSDDAASDTLAVGGLPTQGSGAQPASLQAAGPSGAAGPSAAPAADPYFLQPGEDEVDEAQPPAKKQRRNPRPPVKKQQQRATKRQSAAAAAAAAAAAQAAAAAAAATAAAAAPAPAPQPTEAEPLQAAEASPAPAVPAAEAGSDEPSQAQADAPSATAVAAADLGAEPPQAAAEQETAAAVAAAPEPEAAEAPLAAVSAPTDAGVADAAAAPEADQAGAKTQAAVAAAASRERSTEAEQAMRNIGSWVNGSAPQQPPEVAVAEDAAADAAAVQPESAAEAQDSAAAASQPAGPATAAEPQPAESAAAETQPAEAAAAEAAEVQPESSPAAQEMPVAEAQQAQPEAAAELQPAGTGAAEAAAVQPESLLAAQEGASAEVQPAQPESAAEAQQAAAAPEAAAVQPEAAADAAPQAADAAPQAADAAPQAGAAAEAGSEPAEAGSAPAEAAAAVPKKGRGAKPKGRAKGSPKRGGKAQPKRQAQQPAAEAGEAAAEAAPPRKQPAKQRSRGQALAPRDAGVLKAGARQSVRQAALRSMEDSSSSRAAAADKQASPQPAKRAAAKRQPPAPAAAAAAAPAAAAEAEQPAAAAEPASEPGVASPAAAAQGLRGGKPRAQPRAKRQRAAGGAAAAAQPLEAAAAAAPEPEAAAAAAQPRSRGRGRRQPRGKQKQLQAAVELSDSAASSGDEGGDSDWQPPLAGQDAAPSETDPSDTEGALSEEEAAAAAARKPRKPRKPAASPRKRSRLGKAAAAVPQPAQPAPAGVPAAQPTAAAIAAAAQLSSPAAAQEGPATGLQPAEPVPAANVPAAEPGPAAAAPAAQPDGPAGSATEEQSSETVVAEAAAQQQPAQAAVAEVAGPQQPAEVAAQQQPVEVAAAEASAPQQPAETTVQREAAAAGAD